ncbi:aldose 1-epimerase family protein [Gryllotalpicola daejeonensis]|uniref:Aldose 1-epimerase family protein n=1 Tax=Gryllotalpicola daejeonensis TaxID=993087 RepID=A0ABP7ZLG4_9MICO
MTRPLSGTQYELTFGEYRATIASVGATLRSLTFQGRDLVVPFDADTVRPAYRGAALAPWPNRIGGGAYRFDGVLQQVPLTEPERGNALHGLASWLDFGAIEQTPSRVTLAATIVAQPGYPHRIEVEVVYELRESGLYSAITGANSGPDAAPWGTGPHPYLVAGDGHVDDWSLLLPADEVLEVTPDTLLPLGLASVDTANEGAWDFREARTIGDVFIDHAFTSLTRDASGNASVEVRTADGQGVAITWDAVCPWVQVHTADQPQPELHPELHRVGLAVEPMTCPPDAFNSGTDLIVLAPGESHTAGWTISAL